MDVTLLNINEYPIERAGEVFGTLRPVAPEGQDRRLLARGRNRVAMFDYLAVAELYGTLREEF
ncbi:hypothetical protein CIT26_31805 [Mesorhizobium temperatum]|uniref:Uncharacterized protein n=1 Tax=Mesorhizobium temperatum TaxID=241416 RepID=A0A271L9T7_9HYPH|nr:hypothetical protein CIT26_31805 [Mesorhizobium temperatum]